MTQQLALLISYTDEEAQTLDVLRFTDFIRAIGKEFGIHGKILIAFAEKKRIKK